MTGQTRVPIAVSIGDPAGIGPEIIAKAWAARSAHRLPPFVAVGDGRSIQRVWNGRTAAVSDLRDALDVFDSALPILTVEDAGEISPGNPDAEGARCAVRALELATGLAQSGAASAIVTGPVAKAELYAIGFTYAGQTEFVAERCGVAGANAVMMLAGPTLRVVPITTHVPVSDVPALLTIDLVTAKARATARGLCRNFGITSPRIAIAGLNPHAGEQGAIGREEIDVLIPAIEILRADGIDIDGPFAADTLFHERARRAYDAIMCCYHDQALIPLKTLHFDEGVNITLGLPIVRTSPDHGTAFDIAGTDQAQPGAMIAAIVMAGTAAERRSAPT